ncbi:hypothetical protein B0T26DRAFT_697969 [Lasiosphaeria miniovina]|uniref:rRNA methyltransferase 1, mitochondrial n=1 Tax=Lasiosphaeria miniovina TaxID=1954250 RepID=A0AA40B673_9PEZI|nr:uncharacterized protein B0T26DRAFT_697969 [Lasiosphaeria miniovina]KAK0728445.1 hypothetical protein B0T26DRAFT_697969 [Lasiosphaeria miniovina]
MAVMALLTAHRALRTTALATSIPPATNVGLARRYASLAAIHQGVRRSENVRPQGRRPPTASSASSAALRQEFQDSLKGMTYAERQAARAEVADSAFKIRKGKKDITHDPTKARPLSRQARFYDEKLSFGKKSLVNQLQTGKLDPELVDRVVKRQSSPAPLRPRSTGWRDSKQPEDSFSSLEGMKRTTDRAPSHAPQNWDGSTSAVAPDASSDDSARRERPARGGSSGSGRRLERGSSRSGYTRSDRPSRPNRAEAPLSQEFSSSTERTERTERDPVRQAIKLEGTDLPSSWSSSAVEEGVERPARRQFSDRPARSERPPAPWEPRERKPWKAREKEAWEPQDSSGGSARERRFKIWQERQPVSIRYTTAASQFIYGRSVVTAALRSMRRKPYHLYIYGGSNRQNPDRDQGLEALATRRGVETSVLSDQDGLRMMDKMAEQRPHNGYVLETSPLQQPPLHSLGPLIEAGEEGGGSAYEVRLDYQSEEEKAINGESAVMPPLSATHKPLVVVLDQVLDPGNVGAIMRSVGFLGATALATTKHGSAKVSGVTLKAASGASESVPLYSIPNLPRFLAESRDNGWSVYAAVPHKPSGSGSSASSTQHRQLDVHDVEERDPLRHGPCVLLVGNEGEGLARHIVKSKADFEVAIPNLSADAACVDSLNVSVATALLCSSFLKGHAKAQFSIADLEREQTSLF